MGVPHQIEGRAGEIAAQLGQQVRVLGLAGGAPGATRRIAGVDEHVATARKIDEHGQRLPHVVEMDSEGLAAPTGGDRRRRHRLRGSGDRGDRSDSAATASAGELARAARREQTEDEKAEGERPRHALKA